MDINLINLSIIQAILVKIALKRILNVSHCKQRVRQKRHSKITGTKTAIPKII